MKKTCPIFRLPLLAGAILGSVSLLSAQAPPAPANPPAGPPQPPLFGPIGARGPGAAPAAGLPTTGPVSPVPPPGPAPAVPGVDIDNIAKIPYAALIKIAQSDASQPKDADIYTLRISSKIGVPIAQIELFLNRQNSPEKLAIDPNGYFLVPHNAALLKENPELVSNQPKGSLNLEVKLSLPKPELPKITDGRVNYQDLFKPIQVLNESMRQVDPSFGAPGQQQFAIEFTTGVAGAVKLQRQFGSRTLKPDEQGSVWIIFEKVLFEENPEIQVTPPQAAVSVRPISAAQAAAIRAK